jgi:hypothetical protein
MKTIVRMLIVFPLLAGCTGKRFSESELHALLDHKNDVEIKRVLGAPDQIHHNPLLDVTYWRYQHVRVHNPVTGENMTGLMISFHGHRAAVVQIRDRGSPLRAFHEVPAVIRANR